MARFQIKKSRLNIDTTALCDVGFLLVCFFLLCGRPKPDYENRVHTPRIASYRTCAISEGNSVAIIVGYGKCYFDMAGHLRKAALQRMGKKYGISFTTDELDKFAEMKSFGAPMNHLKQYIKDYQPLNIKNEKSDGIPFSDTGNNQLSDWISVCRQIYQQTEGVDLTVDIIGDERQNYIAIKTIISNLQHQQINKFSMINNAKPFVAAL